MKNILNFGKTLTAFLVVASLSSPILVQAQNAGNKSVSNSKIQKNEALSANVAVAGNTWQSAILRADGLMEVEGVEAYSIRTNCGSEDVVLVKFVNKNNYKVRVEWVDAIKTESGWIYSKSQTAKSLYLEPGATLVGECKGLEKLKVNINSILSDPQSFGHYSVSGLTTTKVK